MEKLEPDWLKSQATRRVFSVLENAGFPVFAVGGCVRNSVLHVPVKDIDLATSAHPEKVMALAKQNDLQAVGTGIEHGTVTVLADGIPFEITTFRRDVETDGRRAVVAFSDQIEDDARRRDFTMNALYLDSSGNLHDPLGGLEDLRARRVRFIEDPVDRIREDYLRSLRYFRFHSLYGNPEEGFDPDALNAIARNIEGIHGLSKERVGAEMKRLLEAPDPAQALAGMRATGLLAAVLPGASDSTIGPLVMVELEAEVEPDAMRRLAVLGGEDARKNLRLSRKEADRLKVLRESAGIPAAELGYRLGAEIGRDVYLVSWSSLNAPSDAAALASVARGSEQRFPVKAADLMPELQGIEIGEALTRLEQLWIDSNFALTREELLATRG